MNRNEIILDENGDEIKEAKDESVQIVVKPSTPTNNFLPQQIFNEVNRLEGSLELSPSGKLLRKYILTEGFGDHHIEVYDRWITNSSNHNVSGKSLTLPDNKIVCFENLTIFPPRYTKDGKVFNLTPKLAREQGITYGGDWHVDVVLRQGDCKGPILERRNNFCIGNVPTMTKSQHCILKGKSRTELELLGEDPDDPGGYFIVGGVEKVVLLQERLVVNKILLMDMDSKGSIVARLTANTIRGTALIELALDKKTKTVIKMRFPSMREQRKKEKNNPVKDEKYKSLNVLRVFRLLGYNDMNSIEQFLRMFIKPERFKKCMLKLTRNFVEFRALPDDVGIILNKMGKTSTIVTDTDKETEINRILDADLFPHLNDFQGYDGESELQRKNRIREAKAYMLGIMVSRFVEHIAGYRSLDDRDSWSNKRTDGAGRMMEQLFRNAWRKTLGIALSAVDSGAKTLHRILDKLHASVITDTFHDSFITSNWGVRGTQFKTNVAQTLVRDSVIATYAHINTVDVSISRTVRKQSLRLIQNSQYGFICSASTPEGENAGLIKNLGITAKVSLERSDKDIIRYLLGDYERGLPYRTTMDYNNQHGWKDGIIVDGKPLGWCNIEEVSQFLIGMRRTGQLALDMSVVKEDGWLYIDISPSRLVRPLLIVNDRQELMIDVIPNARNYTNYLLLTSGCMEYISAWEQEYIKVASSSDKIAKRLDDIRSAEEVYHMAIADLEAVESGQFVAREDLSGQILTITEARDALKTATNDLNKAKSIKPYTHCELDPLATLGVAAAMIPRPNHNQAPRNTYQVSMGKQALGDYHSNHLNRFDGKQKTLAFPNRPMVETEMYQMIGLTKKGTGENVNGAFLAFPWTEEDAFVLKREFLDNGGFRICKYLTYKTVVKHHSPGVTEELTKPVRRANEPITRYDAIQMYEEGNLNNGLPKIGAYLSQGDCVIGKVQSIESLGEVKNESVFLRVGDNGIVEKVLVTSDNKTTVVTVKLRIMRVPEEGDKFAPRNAQKGTVGIVVSDVDLPVDENGIVPDIYMNPHCFTADTEVLLKNGLSRPLTSLQYNGGDPVMSFDKETYRFRPSITQGWESKGLRDIVEVTLSDGRTIRCTPDHKFPVIEWNGSTSIAKMLPLEQITSGHLFLAGIDGVLDNPTTEEKEHELKWNLFCNELSFNMKERDKALAFARLLGSVCTDGCLSLNAEGYYKGNICIGSYIDADNVLDDLELVTGKRPTITQCYSEVAGNTLSIALPVELSRSLATLQGMIVGKKTREIPTWPEFLLREDCPKSIIREFLAAAFGGDGWSPYLKTNKQDGQGTVTFVPPAFSQSTIPSQSNLLLKKMEDMVYLFSRVGVNNIRINSEKKYNNGSGDMVTYCIQLPRGVDFGDKIGFRYCVQKSYRMAAYQSYMRFLDNVKRQNDFVLKRAREVFEDKTIFLGPGKRSLQKSLDVTRKELFQQEPIFNEYYSNGTVEQLQNRKRPERKKELTNWDYSRIEDAEAYLKRIGAYNWFKSDEEGKKPEYIIQQKDENMPYFILRTLGMKHIGKEEVFDLGVHITTTLCVKGVATSNCMPSRMTVSYLDEIIESKCGAVKGTRMNSGAFKPFELDKYREILKRRNYEMHNDDLKREHEFGYEFMRSGLSGRPFDSPVYTGLVFFQALKHHVKDKVQARGTGQFKSLTRQPPKGRGNRGGLRFGEMERDSAISHGASAFLMERLMHVSDAYQMAFCRICGQPAVNDAKIKAYKTCRLCGNEDSFGRCTIPYVYKLLIHLLSAIGINLSPELVTSDEYLEQVLSKGSDVEGDISNVREDLDEFDIALQEEQEEMNQPDDEVGEDYYA